MPSFSASRAAVLLVPLVAAVLPGAGSTWATEGPRRIAISYFDNNSGDPQWDPIRKGLADMLITDLAEPN